MQLYTEKQISEITGRSLPKLRTDRFYKRGLPFVKIGKTVRYRDTDIEKYLEQARVEFPIQ